jgi:hypothetical protein
MSSVKSSRIVRAAVDVGNGSALKETCPARTAAQMASASRAASTSD